MTRARRVAAAAATAVSAAVGVAFGLAAGEPRPGPPPPPASAPAPPAAEGRRSLLGGAVTFALPAGWVLQEERVGCGREGVAVTIPCAPLDGTPHSADVDLLAEANDDVEGLDAWTWRRRAAATPRTTVEERAEGAWRTVISSGVDRGARYVVVERFGVGPRARLHAVAAFPTLPEVGEGWLSRAGEDVDRFLASLSLAGAPPSAVRVVWDGRAARLSGGSP